MKEKIAIAKIIKPHGIEGKVIIQPYSGFLEESAYDSFYIKRKGEYHTIQFYSLEPLNLHKGIFVACLKTKEGLDVFPGEEIFVEELPYHLLEQGEFFLKDLEGLDVFFGEKLLGKVLGVHEVAAKTIVEVLLLSSGTNAEKKSKTVLLPFWEPFLLELDIPHKKIVFGEIDDFL